MTNRKGWLANFTNLPRRGKLRCPTKKPHEALWGFRHRLSREERGLLRHGRVAWLTALEPITVAGPRPIHTAFPASPACKLNFECKPHLRECQCRIENARLTFEVREKNAACSAVFPIGLALFHQGAQTFLRILETVELIQEDVHRLLEAIAQRQSHAAENRFLRHREHRAGVAVYAADEIVHRFFELGLRDEAIDHAEFEGALGGHRLTGQNKLKRDFGSDEKRKNCRCEWREHTD